MNPFGLLWDIALSAIIGAALGIHFVEVAQKRKRRRNTLRPRWEPPDCDCPECN